MGVEFVKGGDEVEKKRMEARERHRKFGIDRSALANADPAFRYKWVNSKPRGVQAAKSKGFEMVPADDKCQAIHGVKGLDGGQVLGEDLVLMREPILDYEVKVELAHERMDSAIETKNEELKEKLNKMVRDEGYRVSKDGILEDNSRGSR